MNKVFSLSDSQEYFYEAVKELIMSYDDLPIAWYSIKLDPIMAVQRFIVQPEHNKYFSECFLSYRYDDSRDLTVLHGRWRKKRFEFNYVSDTVSLEIIYWPPVEVTKKLFKIYILQNDIKSIYDDAKIIIKYYFRCVHP